MEETRNLIFVQELNVRIWADGKSWQHVQFTIQLISPFQFSVTYLASYRIILNHQYFPLQAIKEPRFKQQYQIPMQSHSEESFEHLLHHPQVDTLRQTGPGKLSLKERKAARRTRQLMGKNKGRWSYQERREYYVFLKIYSQFFVSKEHRRNDKVFRMMANHVQTRTPDQCRTHHQKLEFKHFRLCKILESLRNEFGEIQYEEIVKKCEMASTNVDSPTSIQQRDATLFETQKDNFMPEDEPFDYREMCLEIPFKQFSGNDSKKSFEIEEIDICLNHSPVSSFHNLLD